MKRPLVSLLVGTALLGGCQSIGDHFNCMAQVDRNIPAQTQQKYIRTDTKCISSSSGLASPTTTQGSQYIVNGNGQTNCTSTPIYETIVLNQPQRDTAYQQCKARAGNQNSASTYSSGRGSYSGQEAQSMCLQYGNKPNTTDFSKCVQNISGTPK